MCCLNLSRATGNHKRHLESPTQLQPFPISGSKEDWDRDVKIVYLLVFGYAVVLFIGRILCKVTFKKDWLETMKNIANKEKIEGQKSYIEALVLAKLRTED